MARSETENVLSRQESQEVAELRRYFGLPPIFHFKEKCRRCKDTFSAQYVGETKTEFFCAYCKRAIRNASEQAED
jgi:hypothetical protein